MYGEDKLTAKLSDKEQELSEIQTKIQDIESELQFMRSVEVEIASLKEASKTVKHRLSNLSPKQKRIICDLFIDRIEMTRRKENSRWNIQADIYYRFNPERLAEQALKGRTTAQLAKVTKGSLSQNNVVSGGPGGT